MTHVERMKEIKEREQAATAGPWVAGTHGGDWGFPFVAFVRTPLHDPQTFGDGIEFRYGGKITCINQSDFDRQMNSAAVADSKFIAHARADVPFLLSRVKELEAESKAVCDAFAEWESVRTFRNDINSHEWLALVAAVTAMENSDATLPSPD